MASTIFFSFVFSDVSIKGIMGGENIDWAVISVWLGGTIVDESWLGNSSANRTGCLSKLGITLIAQYLLGRRQLGMQDEDILMAQEKYVHEILKKFDMVGCKVVLWPL